MTDDQIRATVESAKMSRKLKDALIRQAIALRIPEARFAVLGIALRNSAKAEGETRA